MLKNSSSPMADYIGFANKKNKFICYLRIVGVTQIGISN